MKDKYKVYVDEKNKMVIAVRRFCGRNIRGTAKCAPQDTFDIEKGKKLAIARCECKVAAKKLKLASAEYLQVVKEMDMVTKKFEKIRERFFDLSDACDDAIDNLTDIYQSLQ